MTTMRTAPRRPGFTRMDLLAVLVLLGLGGGLLVARAAGVRDAVDRSQSQNYLKMITTAAIDCSDTHEGKMPPGLANYYPNTNPPQPSAYNGYGSCLFHILPYLEQEPLYKFTLHNVGNVQMYGGWNCSGRAVKLFVAPGDPSADGAPEDRMSYLANGLVFTWQWPSRYPNSITDGVSNTIFFAEGYARAVDRLDWGGKTHERAVVRRWWEAPVWRPYPSAVMFQAAPPAAAADANLPQGFDPSGIQVALGDRSVRRVNASVSAATFYAARTPNGNEVLGNDW
jgi:hypothetical protein